MPNKKSNKKSNLKGGVFPKKGVNSSDAFRYFIQNCRTTLLSDDSGYGIILKCTLNPGVESPYQTFRPSSLYNDNIFQKDIRTIIVKIVLLYHIQDHLVLLPTTQKTKHTDKNDGFLKEIVIQTQIAIKTSEYLEPVCPIPVYSELCNNSDINTRVAWLNELWARSDEKAKQYIYDISYVIYQSGGNLNYGICAMEFTKGYQQLWYVAPGAPIALDLSRHAFIRLAAAGFIQGDSHQGNVMTNLETPWYYKTQLGNSIILDYGRASKVDDDDEYMKLAQRTLAAPNNSRITRCLNEIAKPPGGRSWINQTHNLDNLKRLIEERLQLENYFKTTPGFSAIFPFNTTELWDTVTKKYTELSSQIYGVLKTDSDRRLSRITIDALQQAVKEVILKGHSNIESLRISQPPIAPVQAAPAIAVPYQAPWLQHKKVPLPPALMPLPKQLKKPKQPKKPFKSQKPKQPNHPMDEAAKKEDGVRLHGGNVFFARVGGGKKSLPDKEVDIEEYLILAFTNILSLGLESLQDVIIATKESEQTTKKIAITGLSAKERAQITPISVGTPLSQMVPMVSGGKRKSLKKLSSNKKTKTNKTRKFKRNTPKKN